MKKLLYFFATLICLSCSTKKQTNTLNDNDSIVTVFASGEELKIPLDSFLQIKDSFVYSEEEQLWMTKELYKWNYGYPDTITVAFTRNGVFEDSVQAVRQGIVYDDNGKAYSPAYVFRAVVGDSWTYDINGKFIEFACSVFPHSGKPHDHYEP